MIDGLELLHVERDLVLMRPVLVIGFKEANDVTRLASLH
jgi:hypothetical protein